MATWAFIRVLDRLAVARSPTGRLAAAVTRAARGLAVTGRAALPRPAVAWPAATAVCRSPGAAVAAISVGGPSAVRTGPAAAPTVGCAPGSPAGGRSAGPGTIGRRRSPSGRAAGPGPRAVCRGSATSARRRSRTRAVPGRRATVARPGRATRCGTGIAGRRPDTVAPRCGTSRTAGRRTATAAGPRRTTRVATRRRTTSATRGRPDTVASRCGTSRTGVSGRRRTARCATGSTATTRHTCRATLGRGCATRTARRRRTSVAGSCRPALVPAARGTSTTARGRRLGTGRRALTARRGAIRRRRGTRVGCRLPDVPVGARLPRPARSGGTGRRGLRPVRARSRPRRTAVGPRLTRPSRRTRGRRLPTAGARSRPSRNAAGTSRPANTATGASRPATIRRRGSLATGRQGRRTVGIRLTRGGTGSRGLTRARSRPRTAAVGARAPGRSRSAPRRRGATRRRTISRRLHAAPGHTGTTGDLRRGATVGRGLRTRVAALARRCVRLGVLARPTLRASLAQQATLAEQATLARLLRRGGFADGDGVAYGRDLAIDRRRGGASRRGRVVFAGCGVALHGGLAGLLVVGTVVALRCALGNRRRAGRPDVRGLAPGRRTACLGGRGGGGGCLHAHGRAGRRGLEADLREDLLRAVLAAPASREGELEVAPRLQRVVVGLGPDALRVFAGLGERLAGLGDDVGRLFLGERDHLLDAEGVAVDGRAGAQHLVQALGLGADHAQLDPHAGGALSLRRRARELLAQIQKATVDLVAVVAGFDDGEVH
ncbi:hypothetical protein DFJ67_7734 [Asanoa ferruginea]|uniref:Uncharacterized protein n=1 Tax=Asanoa ferruginea TaxID=53367 RepID=A0A3D9ZWT7_9ACTN|nr:hypothetical protein DFJ67_7734 [Asanoa ferruginea]